LNKIYPLSIALILFALTAFSFAADKSPLTLGDGSKPSDAPDGAYQIDKSHGYITFSYAHLGYSKPMLRWREWDSTLAWNSSDPSKSTVSVTIDASKIDSGVDVFDDHLRDKKFFDVENYPTITFNSTRVTMRDSHVGTMIGDLTIKGKTLPIDTAVPMVSDEIEIIIQAEYLMPLSKE